MTSLTEDYHSHTKVDLVPPKVPRRWRSLCSLAFGTINDGQEYFILNSLFPVIRDALGLNYAALGIFNAVNELTKIVMQPLWAVAGTHYNRKTILIWFTGFWGIWTMLAGFSTAFTMLIAFFALAMLGAAASGGIVPAVISDLFPDSERSKAFGLNIAIATAAAVLITPIFSLFARFDDGWRFSFFMIGGLSIVSGLLIWRLLDDPGKGGSERELANIDEQVRNQVGFTLSDVPSLLNVSSFIRFVIPSFFDTTKLVFSFLAVYLVDVLAMSNADAILLLVPVIAGVMVGAVSGAFIMAHIHRRDPVYGRLKALSITLLVAFIASILGTQFSYGVVAPYVISFAVFGLTKGIAQAANNPILHAVLLPEQRGPATSLNESLRAVSALLVGLAIGLLSDWFGLRLVFGIMLVGSTFLQLVAFLFIFRTYRTDVERLHMKLVARGQGLH